MIMNEGLSKLAGRFQGKAVGDANVEKWGLKIM